MPKDFSLTNIKGQALKNEPLSRYVNFEIGGPADYFVIPADENDMRLVVDQCFAHQKSLHILGSGTNLLISDEGVRGVVLYMGAARLAEVNVVENDEYYSYLRVPAYMAKAEFLSYAVKNNLSGLEFSAGIPGTMGGAVFMNAGTKWGSYKDVITRVRLYHPERGFEEKTVDEMGFRYRGLGENVLDRNTVVVAIELRLKKESSNKESIKKIDEILEYRGERQPLNYPNCGSVFKNPENREKGAGRMIEACGLKGYQVGQAMLSKKHANFIQNLGGAKASDVMAVIRHAQSIVKNKFSVDLECEVIFMGIPIP